MHAVPYHYDELYGGLADCQGLIRVDGKDLCLEFQVKDSVIGALKSSVKEVRIAIRELSSARLERRWFGLVNKLLIQASRLEPVKDVPGMNQGRIILGIARRDRLAAEQLIADLHLPG